MCPFDEAVRALLAARRQGVILSAAADLLRLYRKGLEHFRTSNSKVTLDTAVSSHQDQLKVRLWKDGKEDAPLDEKSPLGMAIRVVGGDGKPVQELPLKDGYFEITLPKAFSPWPSL